jgi:TATA box-binding protein-associated factor RNA polymerase I subunit B
MKVPNLLTLAKRYVKDLNLPSDFNDYIERLMNFLPPQMKPPKENLIYGVRNFPGRAMAYVLFVMKLIFGIDGFREVQMSQSAKKINEELRKNNLSERLFVYESWREYIEYRNVILNKYYFPYLFKYDQDVNKPYKNFISMLKHIKPESPKNWIPERHKKVDLKSKKTRDNVANAKFLVNNLSKNHERDPIDYIAFSTSFTPLVDAIDAIKESMFSKELNHNILINHSSHSCEYFLKPKKLQDIFDLNDVDKRLRITKATFPKNFCSKVYHKADRVFGSYRKCNITNKCEDAKEWIKAAKEKRKNKESESIKQEIEYSEKEAKRIEGKRSTFKADFKNSDKSTVEEEIYDPVSESSDDDIFSTKEALEEMEIEFEDSIEFVVPDFNLWHRMITKFFVAKEVENAFNALPKSFQWLLNVAAKVINQNPNMLYAELLVIENAFLNTYAPLELTQFKLQRNRKNRFRYFTNNF